MPGGTQALHRSEKVEIKVGDIHGFVPRPNLLGAILLKARAVEIDDAPENQRSDVALLLSLVLDPDAMVDQLEGQERSWIARRHEMDDPNARCWRTLSPTQAQAGLAALRVLAGW